MRSFNQRRASAKLAAREGPTPLTDSSRNSMMPSGGGMDMSAEPKSMSLPRMPRPKTARPAVSRGFGRY